MQSILKSESPAATPDQEFSDAGAKRVSFDAEALALAQAQISSDKKHTEQNSGQPVIVANGMDGDLVRDGRGLPRYNSIHSSPDARFNGLSVLEKLRPETEYKRNVDLDGHVERRLSGCDFTPHVHENSARQVCSEEDKVDEDGQRRASTSKHKAKVIVDVSAFAAKPSQVRDSSQTPKPSKMIKLNSEFPGTMNKRNTSLLPPVRKLSKETRSQTSSKRGHVVAFKQPPHKKMEDKVSKRKQEKEAFRLKFQSMKGGNSESSPNLQ